MCHTESCSGQQEGPKADPIWHWLGYAGYVLLLLCCLIANITAGFRSVPFMLILFGVVTVPLIGTRISMVAIGKIIELRGTVSSIEGDVKEIKGATNQLVQSISTRTGDVNILLPMTTATYEACSRAIINKIQTAIVDLPSNERQCIEQLGDEVRRKMARREPNVEEDVEKFLEEIQKLPEETRKKKGVDHMLNALLALKEQKVL